MFPDLLFGFTVGYAALILLFAAAAAFSIYSIDDSYRPKVSVIVAARNERDRIGPCLDSLVRLTYPRELLEIIIIDDRSNDGTDVIVDGYLKNNPHIRLLRGGPEEGPLRGKVNAVTQGVDIATGEILLFTDADCRVPPGWVEGTVKYYTDPGVGAIAGFTSLVGTDWFSRMQALDWFVLFSVAAATTRMGYPTTAVGTNLSVRREAYEQVGGYRKIPFSVTEDYALFHAVVKSGKYRARFPMDRETLVESAPCETWSQLYNQKKRWFTGGRGMDIKSLLVFALPYLFNVLLLIAGFGMAEGFVVWAAGVKLAVDFLLTVPTIIRFRRPELLMVFPLYSLYYYIYVLIYPPIVTLPGAKVVWKERSFNG